MVTPQEGYFLFYYGLKDMKISRYGTPTRE